MTSEYRTSRPEIGTTASKWWEELHSNPSWGGRGAVARLRRASTPTELVCEPAALQLVNRFPSWNPARIAVIAGVLAWARENRSDQTVAGAIGPSRIDENDALVSEARFRRLMRTDGDAELLVALRRIVRHASGTVNVADLARSVFYWNDRTRERWSYHYYKVGPGAPSRTQEAASANQAA